MLKKYFFDGVQDVCRALGKCALIHMLGWQDMNLRYRRSTLGPFWITLSMGIMIATMGLVFGQLFGSAMKEYLPFLAISLPLWGYISGVIQEGCTAFTGAEGIIKQIDMPMCFHIFRMIWRNFFFFLHNAVIIPLTFLVMWHHIGWEAVLCVPGFVLITLNVSWMAVFTGIFCTRFRDFPQIIASLIMVLFYLTPIMWMPALLPKRASLYLLDLNPFHHLMEVFRAPLLGTPMTLTNWLVPLVMAILGWMAAAALLGRYRHRIAYWL